MENYLVKYAQFSGLFQYPDQYSGQRATEMFLQLEENYPEAASRLARFADYLTTTEKDEIEELYTRTFDVQPLSYLDLGYVLFGEDYKRGTFLSNMKREQDAAGNDCGTELPDNLVNVLTLLPKMKDDTARKELVELALIPAVRKMIAEFEESRVAKKIEVIKKLHKAIIREDLNQGNVYRNLFEALFSMLVSDFGLPEAKQEDPITLAKREFLSKNSLAVD